MLHVRYSYILRTKFKLLNPTFAPYVVDILFWCSLGFVVAFFLFYKLNNKFLNRKYFDKIFLICVFFWFLVFFLKMKICFFCEWGKKNISTNFILVIKNKTSSDCCIRNLGWKKYIHNFVAFCDIYLNSCKIVEWFWWQIMCNIST